MPRKPAYELDEAKQRRLVECLQSARIGRMQDASCKYSLKQLTALEFKKLYPNCHLQANNLYTKALEFQSKFKLGNVNADIDISGRNESVTDNASDTMSVADTETDIESVIDASFSVSENDSSAASIPPSSNKRGSLNKGSKRRKLSVPVESDASLLNDHDAKTQTKTPRPKFEWDDSKKLQLIACFDAAKEVGNKSTIRQHVNTEFKKLYQQCPLHAQTLYNKAVQFRKELDKENSDTRTANALDDGNDSVFGSIVTSGSESEAEDEFAWDKGKELKLLECLETAKASKSGKRIEIRLHEEFLEFHPTCTLKPATLYRSANALKNGTRTTLKSAKPKRSLWKGETEEFLVQCAIAAHKENQTNVATGAYAGKKGPNTNFQKLLTNKFQQVHPHVTADAVMRKFNELQQKYNLKFEAPTTELSDHRYAEIMAYWQHGYAISVRNLYEGCCHACSTLIIYHGTKRSNPTAVNPERVPVLDHYPEEYLNEMFKKSPSQYYKCNVCKGKSLLDLYPLAPQGVKILPIPEQLQNMNGPEKHQIALAGLFSTTEKAKNPVYGQFEHRRGEVNACHKTDQRYFEMYALMLYRSGIEPPDKPEKIRAALRKLREINPLYQRFLANYETLYRYYKAQPNAPSAIQVFDKKVVKPFNPKVTNDMLLEDEPAALLIPDSDLEARGTAPMSETVAAAQHVKDFELARSTYKQFLWVTYVDPQLAEKLFPWLHPYGIGGWHPGGALPAGLFYRWRISMADDRFRNEPNYYFYFLDVLIKNRIKFCNSVKVNVKNLQEPLKKKDFDVTNIYTSKYGTEVPSTIPNSRTYWYSKLQELFAMSAKMGRTPDFFVTLTQNDNWPELRAVIKDGIWASANIDGKENVELAFDMREGVNHPYEMVEAFYRRLQLFKDKVLHNANGPLGKVLDYWIRTEYQQRGGLHVHMVMWCEDGTVPDGAISAEMPRFEHPHNEKWREYVTKFQQHSCRPRCRMVGQLKMLKNCKHGFPFVLCERDQVDETQIRHLYRRRHAEDMLVVPHNLALLLLWGAHINVQRVTNNGWEMYLAKYVAKAATSVRITVDDPTQKRPRNRRDVTDVERYLTTRLVSSIECCAILLQKHHVSSSRDMIYLPIEVDPPSRFVRRQKHMQNTDADSDDIYYQSKLEKYLDRPDELAHLTYPEYYAKYYFGRAPQPAAYSDNNLFDENGPSQDGEENEGPTEPPLVDKKGRYLRRRRGKEAVPYFRFIYPYGDGIELYSLKKLLENVPVTKETVPGLLSRTGSYFQECLDRNLIDQEDEAMHFLEATVKRGFSSEQIQKTAHKLIEGGWLQNQDVDKLLGKVAPCHQTIERTLAREIVDESDETAGLLNVRPRLPLHQYVEKFSDSQRKAYTYVTSRWAAGKAVKAFVCGEAGSGKSFLIDALAAYCKESGRTVQKLGTTGCASYNIGGVTIHAFFKFDLHLNTYLEMGTVDAYFVKNVDVIMIDEVSMLEDALLKRVDAILRQFTERPNVPFGGKSIILFGDVAQLPAIECNIWYKEMYADRFDTIVLRQNMRAADDAFQQLLNRARRNALTVGDWITLYARRVSRVNPIIDVDTVNGAYLVSLRKTKAHYDQEKLKELDGDVTEYVAEDVDESGNAVSEAMSQFISRIERISNLLPKVLQIKPGAKVMLLRNINFREGWVNGRMAIVLCATNDYVVLQAIDNRNFIRVVPRTKQEITWPGRAPGKNVYYRVQFPIELGYAVTVHKAQGHTLDKVIVCAKNFFSTGQFYTAISRVRTKQDLFFTELDRSSLKFAPELGHLLDWFDQVDVLRDDFDGVKPPMPHVPRNWSLYRKTRAGDIKPVTEKDLLYGILDSSDEENDEMPKPPSPRSAVVIGKKAAAKKRPPRHLAPITTAPWVRGDQTGRDTTFKKPLPVQNSSAVLHDMFRAVRDIPLTLDEADYTVAFRRTTSNVDLRGFRDRMRNATETVTLTGSWACAPSILPFRNMSEHCMAVETSGAGHCLYYMASISLFNDERHYMEIRAAVLFTFVENWAHFSDNVALYSDAASLQQIIRDTCRYDEADIGWGSNAHHKALAIASGRQVYIYSALLPYEEYERDIPVNEIQAQIDRGLTQHTRYSPIDLIEDYLAPIMCVLRAGHFSAILKRTPQSRVFMPNARGDIPLEEVDDQERRTVNETPIDVDGDSFMEQFKVPSPVMPRASTPAVKSPGTPGKRQRGCNAETTAVEPTPATASPSQRTSQKRARSPERSPSTPRRSGRKISQNVCDSPTTTSQVSSPSPSRPSSQVRKASERELKRLLDEIKKIPVRTAMRTYVKRVLELTETAIAVEIVSFSETVQNVEPAMHRRSMSAHAAAEKLLYKALTSRARIVRADGTGNCLFSACSIALFGTDAYQLQLRAALCRVFALNCEYFQLHKTTFGEYDNVQKLIHATCSVAAPADDKTTRVEWASRAHLKAIATLTGRHVFVYLPLTKQDRANADVVAAELQSAVDDGDTLHVRYQPLRSTTSAPRPLAFFLTANRFSAVVPLSSDSDVPTPKIMY